MTITTFADATSESIFDIRDVIKRYEELEEARDAADDEDEDVATRPTMDEDDRAELLAIGSFLENVKGYGGDEQWRGDWYPVAFIADEHFEQYAQDFAEDIGAINRDASWPNTCIDWKQAARELQQDYSSVEINGSTYWYR